MSKEIRAKNRKFRKEAEAAERRDLRSRTYSTKEARDNFDRIFGKKKRG